MRKWKSRLIATLVNFISPSSGEITGDLTNHATYQISHPQLCLQTLVGAKYCTVVPSYSSKCNFITHKSNYCKKLDKISIAPPMRKVLMSYPHLRCEDSLGMERGLSAYIRRITSYYRLQVQSEYHHRRLP